MGISIELPLSKEAFELLKTLPPTLLTLEKICEEERRDSDIFFIEYFLYSCLSPEEGCWHRPRYVTNPLLTNTHMTNEFPSLDQARNALYCTECRTKWPFRVTKFKNSQVSSYNGAFYSSIGKKISFPGEIVYRNSQPLPEGGVD